VENISKITPDDGTNKINVQAYWKIFWRKKFHFLVPLVLATVIAVVGVRRLTPIYESKTMILIEDRSLLSPTMERFVPAVDRRNEMRDQQYRAMIDTRLKSRDFLELIIRELGLERSDELRRRIESYSTGEVPLDELVLRYLVGLIKEKIEVQNAQPGFFTIGVYDTDPATAYVLAQRISESFIDVTKQEQIKGIRQAGTFSDEQLAIYKEKLDASERELSRVKRDMSSSAVESNPVNASNVRFAQAFKQTMDAEVERNGIALKRVREKLTSLFNLVPSSERVSSDEAIKNSERQLDAYGEERLLNELRPEPQQEARGVDPFGVITNGLRSRITEIVQDEYRTVSPDVHPLIAEYFCQRYLFDYYTSVDRKLQGYLDQYATNLDRKPALEREYNRLMQEVETNRAIHKAFQESKTSARISEAAQTTNLGLSISIIEKAEKPLVPVKPDPLKIILLAVLFGGMCGLGSILVTEYLDDSFRSVDEKQGMLILYWIIGVVVFVSVMSAALYFYATILKSSGLGIELREERSPGEVNR